MTKDQERAAKAAAREWGKKGGRPRTIPHNPDWEKCACAECRKARKSARSEGAVEEGGPRYVKPEDEEAPPDAPWED